MSIRAYGHSASKSCFRIFKAKDLKTKVLLRILSKLKRMLPRGKILLIILYSLIGLLGFYKNILAWFDQN